MYVWRGMKSLNLEGFIMRRDNFDTNMFSSCSNVETLKVNDVLLEASFKSFRIFSSSLKNLVFSYSTSEARSCTVHSKPN